VTFGKMNIHYDVFDYKVMENVIGKSDYDLVQWLKENGLSDNLLCHYSTEIGSILHKISLRAFVLEEFLM
jgi:hypothetical protein